MTPSVYSSRMSRRTKSHRTITVYENGAVAKGGEWLAFFKYTYATKNNYKSQEEEEMKKFFRT